MTGLRSLLVVSWASLLALPSGGALSDEPASSTKHTASRVNCREAMNAIRSEAGLPDFAAPTEEDSKLPVVESAQEGGNTSHPAVKSGITETQNENPTTEETAQTNFLNNFCSSLSLTGAPRKEQTTDKGTYMVAPATSSGMESCAAAVEFWAEAKSSFTSLPPAYSTSDPLYKDDRNISFVGLFNTGPDPTVDCALITCNTEDASKDGEEVVKPDSNSSAGQSPPILNGQPESPTVGSEEDTKERRLEATDKAANFLICLSSPQALQNTEAPFTQEQWDRIKGVENSSPSPQLFAVVALGAAAYMHYAF